VPIDLDTGLFDDFPLDEFTNAFTPSGWHAHRIREEMRVAPQSIAAPYQRLERLGFARVVSSGDVLPGGPCFTP